MYQNYDWTGSFRAACFWTQQQMIVKLLSLQTLHIWLYMA
ncbi:hypothetical protein HMPREF0322_01593 [Desulfitobacterium hafniense DP7]|uniref:Uncharacterized protein n=1 Tax=Desulfitobacterium hafniense DP7 TaxID=537010 RepID=G9XKY2_DESHA|nr:hypothetical protein HMPREF0322_01593 [Desulfitobacterium hafniense DP7]